MTEPIEVMVESEVGELEAVICHRPGPEVENMDPENAEKALYSDILNLSVARKEYDKLLGVISKTTRTFEVRDLLSDLLANKKIKGDLLDTILSDDCSHNLTPGQLMDVPAEELARLCIEGVLIDRSSLTTFLADETYSLKPLHNFLFIRDAAMALGNVSLIGKMASQVRRREARIMDAVFRFHPAFDTSILNPSLSPMNDDITVEGGDVLVARQDVLCVGIGARTTAQGVDFIIDRLGRADAQTPMHILVQELPVSPESFIHLDMVFTLLDRHQCMVYEPVILKSPKLRPIHVTVQGGRVVDIREEENMLKSLRALGMDLEPILCGGAVERTQKREQWHSGANFFALGPGKVIGYGRNEYTIQALDKAGYSVLDARDVIAGKIGLDDYEKYVVTIRGAELARGGGGCRCLTLPIRRKPLD